ncbi:hypothetical protein TNCT_292211 [Trichonephila clavata]|uniref:Uncharacterized protein n=1 Tax=Trichonephila clavata TaxID=2740835 RepID=A0A8X6GVL5_TRICU|nr:hypothetical protein TNCT_292211 [Trichonephila clavata]
MAATSPTRIRRAAVASSRRERHRRRATDSRACTRLRAYTVQKITRCAAPLNVRIPRAPPQGVCHKRYVSGIHVAAYIDIRSAAIRPPSPSTTNTPRRRHATSYATTAVANAYRRHAVIRNARRIT